MSLALGILLHGFGQRYDLPISKYLYFVAAGFVVVVSFVLVVVFGKSNLLGTPQRWEAAILLILVTATDLFGGYAFNIALSRRMFDIGAAQPSA